MTATADTQGFQIHDVIIIGAGPCGLAVASRLREERPSALFTDLEHDRYHWIQKNRNRTSIAKTTGRAQNRRIIDDSPHGGAPRDTAHPSPYSIQILDATSAGWMGKWKALFRVLEIDHLRSPLFFHVDPSDRDGLKAFAYSRGREKEITELKGVVGKENSKHQLKKAQKKQIPKHMPRTQLLDERDKQDYFTPSTILFDDYCRTCVDKYGLETMVEQANVQSVSFNRDGRNIAPDNCFTIETSTGAKYARVAVLAIGTGTPSPLPISPHETEGACHSSQLLQRGPLAPHVRRKVTSHQSTNVIVVGGGLTSAQIADLCIRKGVSRVWHLMRSDFKIKHFDLDLPWVAKYRNLNMSAFWSAESDDERFRMIQTARNGGSITPAYRAILATHIARKRLSLHTHTTITKQTWDPSAKTWTAETSPPIPDLPPIDFIYYATGAQADINAVPLLKPILDEYPISTAGGLPCLTHELQWSADVPLFVAGRFAGLRLGPGAANLEGARSGAERIVWKVQEVLEGGYGKGKESGENEKQSASLLKRDYDGSDEKEERDLKDLLSRYERGLSHLNMFDALVEA